MSFKAEVQVVGETGWSANALRFPTEKQALEYADELASRWFAVTSYRAVEVDEPVNRYWIDGAQVTPEKHPHFCGFCGTVDESDEHDCPGQQDARARWERSLEGKA